MHVVLTSCLCLNCHHKLCWLPPPPPKNTHRFLEELVKRLSGELAARLASEGLAATQATLQAAASAAAAGAAAADVPLPPWIGDSRWAWIVQLAIGWPMRVQTATCATQGLASESLDSDMCYSDTARMPVAWWLPCVRVAAPASPCSSADQQQLCILKQACVVLIDFVVAGTSTLC